MDRVAEFEKVSFEEFERAIALTNRIDTRASDYQDVIRKMYDELELPKRATTGSAGYDFKSPLSFTLSPGQSMKIPTGIRVRIEDGWWLGCLPRSSLGFKYRFQLDNTVGVIDSDYYYSDNERHIFIKVTNDSKHWDSNVIVEAGNSFVQGIFIPYGITYSDDATNTRNGGMGSTGA